MITAVTSDSLHTLSSGDTHRALIRQSHHTLPTMPRRPRVHLGAEKGARLNFP